MILLYSAILHDIGMAVDTEDLDQIKSENYADNKGCKLPIQLSGIKRIDWIKGIEDFDMNGLGLFVKVRMNLLLDKR